VDEIADGEVEYSREQHEAEEAWVPPAIEDEAAGQQNDILHSP